MSALRGEQLARVREACHPALRTGPQAARLLRDVCGLDLSQIASALGADPATLAVRLAASDARVAAAGPAEVETGEILTVVHLLHEQGVPGEALALARRLRRLLPSDGEVAGLLALLLLAGARGRGERAGDPEAREGIALITDALTWAAPGPFQLRAAIAAVRAEAPSDEQVDGSQIAALSDLLERSLAAREG